MKISYLPKYHPTDGTVYRQTFRISPAENRDIFQGVYKPGINYGNAYTGAFIAGVLGNIPECRHHIKRIIVANSVVFVDAKYEGDTAQQ